MRERLDALRNCNRAEPIAGHCTTMPVPRICMPPGPDRVRQVGLEPSNL